MPDQIPGTWETRQCNWQNQIFSYGYNMVVTKIIISKGNALQACPSDVCFNVATCEYSNMHQCCCPKHCYTRNQHKKKFTHVTGAKYLWILSTEDKYTAEGRMSTEYSSVGLSSPIFTSSTHRCCQNQL